MPDALTERAFAVKQLSEDYSIINRLNLTCGQNSKDKPDTLRADSLALLQNADTLNARGIRTTRLGSTLIADTVAGGLPVRGLGHFYVEGGTKYLTMVAGTKWYYWNGSGNWTEISSVTLTSGLLAGLVVAGNRQFLLNGTDNVFSTTNGTAGTDEGNTNTDVPKSRFGIYHQNMLIVAGNPTNRSYVWPSTVLAPQTFDRSGRVIKIADQDNDDVTALVNMSFTTEPGFLAFKNHSIHFVDTSTGGSDVSQWGIYVVDPVHGAVGSRAAASIGNNLTAGLVVYLSKEGATYRLRSIGRSINDKLQAGKILSTGIDNYLEDVSDAYMHEAIVWYFNQRIFLAFPSGSSTYNDTLCVLDLLHSIPEEDEWKWSVWTGLPVGAIASFEESSVEYPYFGSAGAATSVFRLLSGTSDNGTAIEYQEETRAEDFDQPELDKIFQFIEVTCESTDDTLLTVEAQVDGGGYTILGYMNLSRSGPTLPINLPFNLVGGNKVRQIFQLDSLGIGRTIQFRFTHSELDTTVRVLGYTATAFIERLRIGQRDSS